MRIWLNDFELNNPLKKVYINDEIVGLDMPDIRTSRGIRAGQAGSYIGAQIPDSRYITIKGSVFSESVSEAKQKRREIQAALPLYPTPINVRIIDDDGYSYILVAQLAGPKPFNMPIGRSWRKSIWKLELEATDPIIYDDTAGSSLSAAINKVVPGGVLFSDTSPQFGSTFYFSAGNPNSTIINTSLISALPVITIVGKTSNPVLTNITTGHVFEMLDYSTPDDSVTQIDMQNHTIRLGSVSELVDGVLPPGVGGNVFGYMPITSEFWGFAPGPNEIKFDSNSGTDASFATARWRPGVIGI